MNHANSISLAVSPHTLAEEAPDRLYPLPTSESTPCAQGLERWDLERRLIMEAQEVGRLSAADFLVYDGRGQGQLRAALRRLIHAAKSQQWVAGMHEDVAAENQIKSGSAKRFQFVDGHQPFLSLRLA